MEILGSTQYVDLSKQKDSWYQLNVTNQWDWTTKSICNKPLSDGNVINYHLKLNTPISNDSYKSETVTELTEEMKDILKKRGYNVF